MKNRLVKFNGIWCDVVSAIGHKDNRWLKEALTNVDDINIRYYGKDYEENMTILGECCIYGETYTEKGERMLRTILEAGADPNIYFPYNPLSYAWGRWTSNTMFDPYPCDLPKDIMTHNFVSALHIVSSEKAIDDLLKHGANINARESSGMRYTPLHWAVMKGAYETVETLLKRGADMTLRAVDGTDIYDMAKKYNDNKMIEIFKKYEK